MNPTTPTTTSTGNPITDIYNVLTGKTTPKVAVDTSVNIGMDNETITKLGLTIFVAGIVLIIASIYLNKYLK